MCFCIIMLIIFVAQIKINVMNDCLFSSKSFEWSTPQYLFDSLNKEFGFDIDVAASDLNHMCDHYYTISDNGLEQVWRGVVWCNPPYGREIYYWVEKAYYSTLRSCQCVVMLLPARTDTKWFHRFIYKIPRVEVRFLQGRLHFSDSKNAAPFPSMIVIFYS